MFPANLEQSDIITLAFVEGQTLLQLFLVIALRGRCGPILFSNDHLPLDDHFYDKDKGFLLFKCTKLVSPSEARARPSQLSCNEC